MDALLETESLHSLVSDEAGSYLSRYDPSDADLPEIIQQSRSNPHILVGWRVNVQGHGIGVILEAKKRLGMTTLFKVRFSNGRCLDLALQRGSRKGVVPFTPLSKFN